MTDIAFYTLPNGGRIAHRFTPGAGPTIIFLPGYMSDMAGSKAEAVFDWARANRHGCLCLDYSGCGQSGGAFAEGTLSRWREEVLALIAALGIRRVLLVGSSMGGWLMLLVALALGEPRIDGLIGIAAAPDFTDWGFTPDQKAELAAGHTIYEPNPYGPEPTPTHPGFWADGQRQRLLESDIALTCPVHLLHGMADDVVPWQTAPRLAASLRSDGVQITLVKASDHRLSRPEDIALLLATLAAMIPATAR